MANLSVEQALLKAKFYKKNGNTAEAQKMYQTVLEAFPENKKAQLELSILNKPYESSNNQSPPQEAINQLTNLYNHGQLSSVIEHAQTLTIHYPNEAFIWNILGASAAQLDKLDQAVFAFQKVISLKPDYVDAYNNMGNALTNQGKLEEAIEAYKTALTLKPDYVDAYNNMGAALREQGKLEEAIEACNKVLALNPDYADGYNNLGVTLKEQGKLDEAIEAYNTALSLNPDYADGYNNLGNALTDQGRLEEAIESYKTALILNPNYADAYNNMGAALRGQGKLDEAIEAYNQALLINPDHAAVYNNMGVMHHDEGRMKDAISYYERAIGIKPDYADAHMNRGFALLNEGELKQGLEEYEWRLKRPENFSYLRRFSRPIWDGNPNLSGKKILLWSEQGPGDVVMWLSTLQYLIPMAKHCIIECPEKLLPLLERSFPNVEVRIENKSKDPQPEDFDLHLPIGSLFKHFISEISSRKTVDAFLVPDPLRVEYWRKRLAALGNGHFVGISWKSPMITPRRLPNYTEPIDWKPVLSLPGKTFINLQSKNFDEDILKIKDNFGVTIHNFKDIDHYDNLDDVAALGAALDICISVSTTVSTITAAVGTPTKMLHWRQSSWNNILNTPPGPNVDVFERNTWETWEEAFKSIAMDIRSFDRKK